MIYQVVSIYDRKMSQYSGLYLVRTLEEAARSWGDSIMKDEVVRQHPEDFRLDKIADFDPESGEVRSCSPSLVLEAETVIRRLSPSANGQLELQ